VGHADSLEATWVDMGRTVAVGLTAQAASQGAQARAGRLPGGRLPPLGHRGRSTCGARWKVL